MTGKRAGKRNVVELDHDHVLKIGEKSESARPQRLFVESFATRKAEEYGLAVPRLLSYGILVDGREYIKFELIKGKKISDSTVNLFGVFRAVGAQFKRMPLEFKKFGWINAKTLDGDFTTWKGYLRDFTKKYGLRLCKRGLLKKSKVSSLLKQINSLPDSPKESGLVHRDLKPENLIYNHQDKKVYICDWENAILGDPLFDLAVLKANFKNPKICQGFIAGLLGRPLNDGENQRIDLYSIIAKIGLVNFSLRNNLPLGMVYDLNKSIKDQ